LGVALYLNNKAADARKALDSTLVLNPRFADAYLCLTRIAHESGRTTEAGQHLTKALELEPKSVDVQSSAGDYSLTRGKFDEAASHFQTAEGLRPKTPSLVGQLGIAQLFAGKTDAAIDLLKDAADKSKLPRLYWYLGWAYRLQDEDKDARKAFEKCVEAEEALMAFNPHILEDNYRLAWAKYLMTESGNLQAEANRLDGLSLQTTNKSIKPYLLAGMYVSVGDQGRALQLLGEVKKLNYYSSAFLAANPTLASLRDNAEFRKLVGLDE
jgi:predicted Zn-dependent protease